ncbi:AraC family transcriptional regulator [Carbonactinospora thermoautotrophica]|uniref:AraC family transcriptional regulator n=1 Tax=Carbonactinospora thermoautotrophica TaxID=1469144 RepID=UPI00226E73BE|nr:AraC family transcriptional regulator N-terminal domain-containing protein [Carbonactinospora thermoautotrophica]MCX9191050.1 AraC family transcriptional regulator [Carbonactinospora thermoautotrophica]
MAASGEKNYQFLRDDLVAAGEVARLVDRYAEVEGANEHSWPGLTFYRFSDPVPPHWDEVASLSYCLVVQGAKKVRIGSEEYLYDPMRYLVLNRRARFEVEIVEASQARPFLSFVLQIEPALVSDVLSTMHRPLAALYQEHSKPRNDAAHVALLDSHIIGATYRFLTALESEADRAVLAPIYLREIVYRLLQTEERHRLIESSRFNACRNPVSAAIEYMKKQIHEPISVAAIAEAVCMSESAFAHLFKQTVGTSPYKFLKQLRLERARDLLLDHGYSVSEAASKVGYTSLSHFISEFKRYFGETPRSYLLRLQGVETFNLRAKS